MAAVLRRAGIDPAWAPREGGRRNPSIGAAESTLLRRVNARLKEAGLPSDQYRALVRQLVVHETLAERPRMQPVTLPPDAYDWAEEVAQGWIDWVKGANVDVVGDLEELRPVRPPAGAEWRDPDRPRPRDVTSAAIDAIVALALEAARRPDPDDTLTSRAAKLARHLRAMNHDCRRRPGPGLVLDRAAARGRYDALAVVDRDRRVRARAATCPAPSSSSCCAG